MRGLDQDGRAPKKKLFEKQKLQSTPSNDQSDRARNIKKMLHIKIRKSNYKAVLNIVII